MNIPYEELRAHYASINDRIYERSAQGYYTAPYSRGIDFVQIMSPIEFQTWQALRCFGRMPLYPQYPVGKYWADFANPYFKIAIECDGKAFHTDYEKDRQRDIDFNKMGWEVYRITGADCNRIVDIYVEDEDMWDRDNVYYKKLDEYYAVRSISSLIL